jgi:signal peptidase I
MLIPGAGQFVNGRKPQGIAWFILLFLILVLAGWSLSARALPGFLFAAAFGIALAGLWLLMLRNAYRPTVAPRGKQVAFLAFVCSGELFLGWWMAHRLAHPFVVPTSGMDPTIQGFTMLESGEKSGGDRVFVERTAYWYGRPRCGDIVAFRTDSIERMRPEQRGHIYMKRIVGVPGDRISIRGGRLTNHGKPVEQPAVFAKLRYEPVPFGRTSAPYLVREEEEFEVPADSFFVIGDNSTNSYDSRIWGVVPKEALIGRVSKIYWPPARAGSIK